MARKRQEGPGAPSPDGAEPPTLAGNDLLAAAADWLWESGTDGAVSFLSPEFEPSTGVAPQSLLGRDWPEFPAADEAAAAQRAAIAKHKPFRDLVLKLARDGGAPVWIEIAGRPTVDGVGRFSGYRGVGKTVTAEIGAMLALRKSERRFCEFFEVASDWFWETDAENRNTYLSPSVEKVLGLPVSSYIGKRLADTEGVMIEPEAGRMSLAIIKARKPYSNFVYSRKLPSGRVAWISISGSPYYDEDGVFQGYRGVARDITAQVETERALKQSEHRFRELFEIASDYFWETDRDKRVTYLSENYEKVFGIPPSEMLGKRLTDAPGVSVDAEMGKMVFRAIKARQPYRDFVYSRRFPSGETRWFKISAIPIFGADGEFQGYRGVGADMTGHVEADQAARLAQSRLHDAVAYVTQPFVFYDAQHHATAFNQAFTDLHREPGGSLPIEPGVTYHTLAEWQLRVGFYAAGPEEEDVTLDQLLDRYENAREHTYHLRDGRWMLVAYRCLPGGGRVGLWTEVTAIMLAEQALRNSEQRFREMCETAYDYFWETDTKGRVTFLSPTFDAIFGVSAAELQGKRLVDMRGFSMAPEMQKTVVAALMAREPYRDLIFSVTWPDGPEHWVRVSAMPFFKNGEFHGYRGVGTDITAHRRAEETARSAERRLQDAVARVRQPFALYDAEDQVLAFNQAFADLHLGPDGQSAICHGMHFSAIAAFRLHGRFYAQGPDDEAIDLEALLVRQRGESEHVDHLGDGRWMLVDHRRLPDGGSLDLWTDITAVKNADADRRMLEGQLHHAQRLEALGTLAGGAAHEINNALVPVIALTKMVARRLPEDSRDRRSLGTVLVGAERSRDLVKQILAFSRKQESERRHESVDLAAVLGEALQLMRATVPTSIRIEDEIAAVPSVPADPNQLHQVVVNLVTNAAQAIGEAHGTITVGLRADADGAVRFWVADTGCGMNEATKARIFEPFFTTKEVGKGTGLGLSVVHGIIKDHGGRIEIESTPGRGTRFDIVLPLTVAQAGAAA